MTYPDTSFVDNRDTDEINPILLKFPGPALKPFHKRIHVHIFLCCGVSTFLLVFAVSIIKVTTDFLFHIECYFEIQTNLLCRKLDMLLLQQFFVPNALQDLSLKKLCIFKSISLLNCI